MYINCLFNEKLQSSVIIEERPRIPLLLRLAVTVTTSIQEDIMTSNFSTTSRKKIGDELKRGHT